MAAPVDIKQAIIDSVFSRRNASGGSEESYISHVKVWEDAGPEAGELKHRYILLAQASNGSGFIHKSKLNSNGSFSVGKTWRLLELRGLEVLSPTVFNITLGRSYRWQTENPKDQVQFLWALVDLFRNVSNGAALQLSGMPERPVVRQVDSGRSAQVPTTPTSSRAPGSYQSQREPRPSNSSLDRNGYDGIPNSTSSTGRSRAASQSRRRPSPQPSRAASPAESVPPPRVPTPSSQAQSGTPRPSRARRPSNAGSSTRESVTSNGYPAINAPPSAMPTHSSVSTFTSSMRSSPDANPNLLSSRPSFDASASATSLVPSVASRTPTTRSVSPAVNGRTVPSRGPSRGPSPAPQQQQQQRRDHNARVSFFDPPNQAALDRLVSEDPEADGGEEESTQATMASVEEMLEGYEWASDDIIGRKRTRGAVDQIEARLLDELMALEKANIHSFIESDDRVGLVLKYMDEAIAELDNMESSISSYKIHLNAVNDDISFIQSQNRGLQVQTQNQRALLNELEQLLQTVQVDRDALITLTQESLSEPRGIQRLEEALTELYKALQAGRDTDMAATMERLDEYRTHNAQFCKRLNDYLSIMFTAQSKMLLGENEGVARGRGRFTLLDRKEMENYLGRYSGLILYLKEMDEGAYARLCADYFSASSQLHRTQISALLSLYGAAVKKGLEEEGDQAFLLSGGTAQKAGQPSGLRRAGTIVRSPLDRKDKDKAPDGDMPASEAFGSVLEQIAPQVYREQEFIADFLQINEASLTFADYMGLENYFRRQASRAPGLSQSTMKLVRGALDLIFGFLPAEMKAWIDAALAKDNIQIIGILAVLDRFLSEADERGNTFVMNFLEKQQTRLKALFDRHVNSQIKAVEDTKLTSKKRNGVAPFIKSFPIYVSRVESQLINADTLEVRQSVDMAYEKIVQTMFDSLKQMAKMDGEGEDKGQLNYHVILIENMHYFVAEIRQQEIGSVIAFSRRAENLYDENLNAYVKIVLRRPFYKIIDYFDGVERLLKTTAPTEVSSNSSYNRSSLKKIVKEYNSKDIRKQVDALFKRVEKHFDEAEEKATTEQSSGIVPGTVMVGVWKACEEELLRITEVFNKRISQCYANTGVALEYSAADVEAAFKRHRVGS